jgi:hypothetical protein
MKVGDLVIKKDSNELAIITDVNEFYKHSLFEDGLLRLTLHFLCEKPSIYYAISDGYENLGTCPSLIKELI